MKQKMTISELRNFIQEQALNLLAEHLLNENQLQKDSEAIRRDLEMRMNSNGSINLSDLEDVASEHGLNLDDEDLMSIQQSLMSSTAEQRNSELNDDIQYVIDSHFQGEVPESFQEFYNIFNQLQFDNAYTPEEVKKKFMSITTNPNQLALFESALQAAYKRNKSL